jgi:hypothetical protein
MLELQDLYRTYFQKSKVFLYPTLNIKRGNKFIPIDTYISWKNEIDIISSKLICLYQIKNSSEFKYFEDKLLFNNKLFDTYYQINENQAIYVFNIDYDDWKNFIRGKYSKLSIDLKKNISKFYGKKNINSIYIDSFLYPKDYYDKYSKFLTTNYKDAEKMERLLNKVGELCDPPDLKKEELQLVPKILKLEDI